MQPLLPLALAHVAHATIRNRGTVVGSLVHADAAAELPAVLCVLGGRVTAASVGGSRVIRADALFAGPLESTVRHDEIAVEAFFPALAPGEGVGFEELARRHGDYALCGVATVVRVAGSRVVSARAGYLSVSDVPTVVDLTAALDGGVSTRSTDAAGDAALERLDPADDLHATAAYRGPAGAGADRPRAPRGVRRRASPEAGPRWRGAARRSGCSSTASPTTSRVPARRLLSDALRHDLGLTGTHVGCEHGVCGACTVLVDGRPMRSCLLLAVSAVDAEITTVEGLAARRRLARRRCSRPSSSATACSAASARPAS